MKTFTIILIILLVGGILAYWYWWRSREELREITEVRIYFKDFSKRLDCKCDNPVIRKIPKTKKVERAGFWALEELIKGPTENEQAQGYNGCLPREETVRRYREWYEKIVTHYKERGENIDSWGQKFLSPNGKFSPWSDQLKIKSVKVKDGIAYADFSKELYSYGGGFCFVEAIGSSIINTLKQFPEVKEVKILVEGREAELEP